MKNEKLIGDVNRIDNNYLYLGFFIAIVNSVLRKSLSHILLGVTNLYSTINIIALILFLIYIQRNTWKKNNYDKISLFAIFIFSFLVLYSNLTSSVQEHGLLVLLASIVPGMLMIRYNPEGLNFDFIFSRFVKIFNYVTIPIFCIGIFDYFLGGVVNLFIAAYLSPPDWATMIIGENSTNGFRMCTIIGSPLMNSFYAVLFVVLNTISKKIEYVSLNKYFVYLFGIVVIILSGGRTALLCVTAFIVLSEFYGKMPIGRLLLLVTLGYIVVSSDLFINTIGQRFNREDDVRFRLWEYIADGYYGNVGVFQGGGFGYSRYLTGGLFSDTTNFEYPWLMFAFDYGIFATICYYLVFLVIPVLYLYKKRETFIIISYATLFLTLQTCNLIAGFYDFNLLLGFLLSIFIGISKKII